MKFDKEDLLNFLKDVPFYKNDNCFCLGNSLEEAGSIVNEILAGGDKDVGMAAERTEKSCTSNSNVFAWKSAY